MDRKVLFLLSSLFTMLILGAFMFISEETLVDSPADIENLKDNSVVSINSKVTEFNPYPYYTKIKLSNSIQVLCKGCDSDMLGKNVIIKGVVDEYDNKKTISILSYKIIND